jgi:hypothetical protein
MAYPPQSELLQATEPLDHVILSEAKDLLLISFTISNSPSADGRSLGSAWWVGRWRTFTEKVTT